jgi:hypothetical protein
MRQVIFGILAVLASTQAYASDVFPTVSVGDAFTGSFTINPNAPVTNTVGPTVYYSQDSGAVIGSITTTVDGGTFYNPLTLVGAGGGYWAAQGTSEALPPSNFSPVQFNGSAIPEGTTEIVLVRSVNSTSILPLSFSSYSAPNPSNIIQGPNILFGGVQRDYTAELNAAGYVTSVIQETGTDTYDFSGIITTATLTAITPPDGYIPPLTVLPIPEPSTWAMLLIGFAGIGFVAHRRRRENEIAANQRLEES